MTMGCQREGVYSGSINFKCSYLSFPGLAVKPTGRRLGVGGFMSRRIATLGLRCSSLQPVLHGKARDAAELALIVRHHRRGDMARV